MTDPTVPYHRSKGRVQHHDERSRSFAVAPAAPNPAPWRHMMGPVLDQGQISGCTGWSGADWLNSASAVLARKRYNKARIGNASAKYVGNADGLYLYEQATQNDDLSWTYPPTDNGSTGLGVAKALQKMGVIPEYKWTFDFNTTLAYAQQQPVLLGTVWTDAMMEPDAHGILNIGTDAQVKAADDNGEGHEYCLIGGNLKTGLARIRNHWTAQWGLGGDALIPLSQLETLIIKYRGDVCVPEVS